MKNNKKGFTLAELLVVVGIIAVLIAIAVPAFSGQVEKAAEATDAANIRSAYAELVTEGLAGTGKAADGSALTKTVSLKQTKDGWANTDFANKSNWPENLSGAEGTTGATPVGSGKATLTYVLANPNGSTAIDKIDHVTIAYSAS